MNAVAETAGVALGGVAAGRGWDQLKDDLGKGVENARWSDVAQSQS
jgi:hypothetical protein